MKAACRHRRAKACPHLGPYTAVTSHTGNVYFGGSAFLKTVLTPSVSNTPLPSIHYHILQVMVNHVALLTSKYEDS